MPTSDNAIIEYEASQALVAMAALTDSGDAKFFKSPDLLWSNKSGAAPDVKPDGVINGFVVTPGTAADTIDVAAGSLYQAGVKQPVGSAAAEAVARGASAYVKTAITVDDSQAIVVIQGAPDASGFSTEYGAAGGPPFIPVGSTVVSVIWYSSTAPAVVAASEIKQKQGDSLERWDFPSVNQKRLNVTNGVSDYAGVEFVSSLALSHTGGIPKAVFAEYYTPEFSELPNATDFVPAETTNTTTSIQVYNNTIGAASSTLNQSSFTFYPNDGITDASLKEKGQNLFFKFKQDRYNDPYLIQQGTFGIGRTFPAAGSVAVAATVSCTEQAVEVFS